MISEFPRECEQKLQMVFQLREMLKSLTYQSTVLLEGGDKREPGHLQFWQALEVPSCWIQNIRPGLRMAISLYFIFHLVQFERERIHFDSSAAALKLKRTVTSVSDASATPR